MQQSHLQGVLSNRVLEALDTPIVPVQRAPFTLPRSEAALFDRWIEAKLIVVNQHASDTAAVDLDLLERPRWSAGPVPSGMGAAAAIMIVCDNKAGRGDRGGNRSATSVAGRLGGEGGPGGQMLPAPRDARDADGCGAGELLDAGRSPRSRQPAPPPAFPGPCGVEPRYRARRGGPVGRTSTRR